MEFAFDDDDDRERDDGNGDEGEGSELPYPAEGDNVGPHPAFRDEHEIDQVWFHKARDMGNEDSDTDFEYHHSESRVKLQSSDNQNAVIWSDWSVNLDRCR